MSDKHLFADLEAYNRIHEGRFDLPPLARRQQIQVGQFAQLATADPAHHWVWVQVFQLSPYGYRGIVAVAPAPDSSCPVAAGDRVDFSARHVHKIYTLQAVTSTPTYQQILADAQALDAEEFWSPVLATEEAEITKRIPPSMRDPDGAQRRAEYVQRHPWCASCEARGLRAETFAPVYVGGPDAGDGDDNLTPLCRISIYVLVARANGWPVRGCDIDGIPNDPEHPWNA